MKKLSLIAVVLFAAGTVLSSCCCNDANAPKLPAQPKFKDIPEASQPATVAPVKVTLSKK